TSPEGMGSGGERRKTAVLREGPPGPEYAAPRGDDARRYGDAATQKAVAGGSMLQSLAGICAAVLAILALSGTLPMTLATVAVIVMGGAQFIGAGGISAAFGRRSSTSGLGGLACMMSGGIAFQALCGAAAVAGGILTLANVVPMTFLPVSVIILGACSMAGSGGLHFLNLSMSGSSIGSPMTLEATRQAIVPTSGVGILVGEGAVALGVLALAGVSAFLLTEIAILALGLGLMAGGAALAAHGASALARS